MMKIFEMNDNDWVAAESLEEAVRFYAKEIGEDTSDARELSEDELKTLVFCVTDEDERTVNTHSFRTELNKRLKAAEIEPSIEYFPQVFASKEI